MQYQSNLRAPSHAATRDLNDYDLSTYDEKRKNTMPASGHKSLPTVGFLTVMEDAQFGLFGGYLVLNAAGRPVEFHCTAPVKPSRAQEILYGPTLRPFLYGEQIGKALIGRAKSRPLLACTDVWPAMAVRPVAGLPVVWIDAADDEPVERNDAAYIQAAPDEVVRFTLGRRSVGVSATHQDDRQRVVDHYGAHLQGFDLVEPFQRIRDAIKEAQSAAA